MLLESEHKKERDHIKYLIHGIYEQCTTKRIAMRNFMANECYKYIYGNNIRSVTGIKELLEIYC